MRRGTATAVLIIVALSAASARAGRERGAELVGTEPRLPGQQRTIIWFDDMEGGASGWTHADGSVTSPHFHVDTYMAYEGGHSWWCGTFDYDVDGGYGNDWDDRLSLPPVNIAGLTYPVLSFAYRCDSEPGYDVTRVEARVGGVFVPLGPYSFDAETPWTDLGVYGFSLVGTDNPLLARLRFVSDDAFSDQDGLWATEGGAFMADNVRVFDFYLGTTPFLDDAESGGLCSPGAAPAAGDHWHLVSRLCPAYSDPHSWWCGDDADTSHTPPGLKNSLTSPPVDISSLSPAAACTVRFLLHAEVPTDIGDFYKEEVTTDGGTTWHTLGTWWGDFGQCDGWAVHGIVGYDLSQWLPGTTFSFRLTFYSDDDGCGPGVAGGAGIMLDDTWLEAVESPVQRISWGAVKALFR